MSEEFTIGPRLPELVNAIVKSYWELPDCRRIDRIDLPSRDEIVELAQRLLELVYPGFIGRQDLTQHNVAYHVGELIPRIGMLAHHQIFRSLCYMQETEGDGSGEAACRERATRLTAEFLERLPRVREMLSGDVRAAYDGDPAALNTDEVILAYPGLLAVTVFRFAHELYDLGIPLMARVMTEWAHSTTGVDLHPGARIGHNFFIDHATGVVIGETTDIGDNVKLYQGVTLGALSFPKDERGRLIRGYKRHPTVGDSVTIYANAIILGGDTHIGEHSVIGGSVFLTSSVPPYSTVTFQPPELKIKDRNSKTPAKRTAPDYQI
ncbi:MAG TPA: serine O-acetyltransferase EpsC [Phycisphaerae bacterium]|nr:serine O-acetyltransferase EpsC [Phycisphaerae bacterium]